MTFTALVLAVARFIGEKTNTVCGFIQRMAEEYPRLVGSIVIVLGVYGLISWLY